MIDRPPAPALTEDERRERIERADRYIDEHYGQAMRNLEDR